MSIQWINFRELSVVFVAKTIEFVAIEFVATSKECKINTLKVNHNEHFSAIIHYTSWEKFHNTIKILSNSSWK